MTTADASLLLQAAAAAAGAQAFPRGALYVVATPIGNLADLTLRAIHVLSLVDAVACEDTRHSAALMRHLGLDKPLLAAHQHNEREAAEGIASRLAHGERVAYVSDAGTPGISDPGAALVAAMRQHRHPVVTIPGVSSATAAISVAGDVHAARFAFVGFLPSRASDRATELQRIAASPDAQVLFEAPHRIEALGDAIAAACGSRPITVCRELTKQFESVSTMPAQDWPAWMADDANRTRGEFVVVVHGRSLAVDPDAAGSTHDKTLNVLLGALPLKQAVALTAELTGAARNALYARALVLKQTAARDDDSATDA